MEYDVLIAGGSFSGLAVAAQLRGKRVLIVEPHTIGAVQTSACGTLLAVLEATKTMDSLLQIHERFVLHLPGRTIEYHLPYPFCTFDYHTFCHRLLEQGDAEILQASVHGHDGHRIYTTKGVFKAGILVDASGWRAALATNSQGQIAPHRGKSFGLETVIPVSESGLHFYYDPSRFQPYHLGWLFPVGAFSRVGFASYQGSTRLNDILRDFVSLQFGLSSDGKHGGYFPYQRQPAITGCAFRVGDAAGQCLPFSGEGIRPALSFGTMVGRLARRVLEGEILEDDAFSEYLKFVKRYRQGHSCLFIAQKVIPGLPIGWIENIAGLIQRPDILDLVLWWYWNLIDPTMLASMPENGLSQSLPGPYLVQPYGHPAMQHRDR